MSSRNFLTLSKAFKLKTKLHNIYSYFNADVILKTLLYDKELFSSIILRI